MKWLPVPSVLRWLTFCGAPASVLRDDRVERLAQAGPNIEMMRGSILPGAAIVLAPVIGTADRHRLLDGLADPVPVVGQIACIQRRLNGHHPAANIDPDRRGNDGAPRRNHAAHGRTNPPVHIGHRRHPLVDERQLRNVE